MSAATICVSMIQPIEERFWSKVNKNGSAPKHCPKLGACWLWTGATIEGYGIIALPKHLVHRSAGIRTHRLSYQLHYGNIPDGLDVLHRCDTRNCVNPAHLFLGTDIDNSRDKYAKGRNVNLRGSLHGMAKLTEKQVAAIVDQLPKQTHANLAALHNVTETTISDIARGRIWSHVTGIIYQKPPRPHFSKICAEDARQIAQLFTVALGPSLAKRFGVSIGTVKSIGYGKRWSEATGVRPGDRRPNRLKSA